MMRTKPRLVFVLVFALVVGAAAAAAPPTAASIGIGVTPSLLELSATPSGTGTQELQISNVGDQPVAATVAITDLPGATATHSAVRWLNTSATIVQLAPKQHKTIKVAITVPPDLPSGGYYALVTITTGNETGQSGERAMGMAGQLGVPFLFTVKGKGEIKREASLSRFAPVLEPDGRLGFHALVRSSGNVYVNASGKVEISTAGGKHYAKLDFPDSGRILPEAERLLKTQGSVPIQPGATYRATVTMDYGDGQQPLTADANFTMQIPALAVANMSVCENLDLGPTLTFGLTNDGTLGVQPDVTLTIKQANGAEVGSTAMPDALVWPTDTTKFNTTYAQRLTSGNYIFVISAQIGHLAPVTKELPFQIGGIGGHPVPLCTA